MQINICGDIQNISVLRCPIVLERENSDDFKKDQVGTFRHIEAIKHKTLDLKLCGGTMHPHFQLVYRPDFSAYGDEAQIFIHFTSAFISRLNYTVLINNQTKMCLYFYLITVMDVQFPPPFIFSLTSKNVRNLKKSISKIILTL